MPGGTSQWQIDIQSNVDNLKKELLGVQSQVDKLTKGTYKVDLSFNTKHLENAMKNLDKMLDSLGKEKGDFSQFNNLASQIEVISKEAQELNKAFGNLGNQSGAKSLLDSVRSIDSSLDSLVKNLNVVRDGYKQTANAAKELQNASKNTQGNSVLNSGDVKSDIQLLSQMESHLASIKSALTDVGDGGEMSPLLSMIEKISGSIKGLSKALNGLSFNINIDNVDTQSTAIINQAKSSLISAYQRAARDVELSNLGDDIAGVFRKGSGTFVDFGQILDPDVLIGRYEKEFDIIKSKIKEVNAESSAFNKKYIEDAKKRGASLEELKKIEEQAKANEEALSKYTDMRVVSGAKRSLTNAINKASNASDNRQNDLNNLFKTDLSGVIDQLKEIVQRLDEMAQSVKTVGDSFANGFNVNTSIEEVNKLTDRIKQLEDELAKLSGKKVGVNTSQIDQAVSQNSNNEKSIDNAKNKSEQFRVSIEKVHSELETLVYPSELNDSFNKAIELVSKLDSQLENGKIDLDNYNASSRNVISNFKDEIEKNRIDLQKYTNIGANINAGKYAADVAQIEAQYEKWGVTSSDVQSNIDALSAALVNLEQAPTVDGRIKAEEKYQEALRKTKNSIKQMKAEIANGQKVSNLYADVSRWQSRNSKANATFGIELNDMIGKLKNGVGKLNNGELIDMQNRFKQIQAEASSMGLTGSTMVDMIKNRFKSLGAYLASFASFYRIIGYIKEAITTVKDLDTALIDLRKTTTMSKDELNNFYFSSNDVAKEMGVTTQSIIEQAAAWSRLGYSQKEQVETMSRLSSQFASISPGMDTTKSQEGLVSAMKGFDIDVADVEREIMDNVNKIGRQKLPTCTVMYSIKDNYIG